MREIRDKHSTSKSKSRRILKSGDIVKLYVDYQNNKEEIGRAKLITFLSEGLTFILPDNDNIVYNTQRWEAEIVKSVHPKHPVGMIRNYRIRFVEKVGQPDKTGDIEYIDTPIEDNFLEVDGIQIF